MTARCRLTVLYGVLFTLSGAALLGVAYLIVLRLPWLPKPSLASPGFRDALAGQKLPPGIQQLIILADERKNDLHLLLVWSVILLISMTVVSAFLGWVMAGRVLRPVQEIMAATRRISEANLHERLGLAGPRDEMRELGDTIDGLLERLEEAFEARQSFVANASHELRTPIAMMRTSVDVATAKVCISDDARTLAAKVEEGLVRAERLLESLLVLARTERAALGGASLVSLSDLVADAVERHQQEVHAMGLVVEAEVADVWCCGSEVLLDRLVGNLVTNAVQHNEPGGIVRVRTDATADGVRLVVEGSGATISPDELRSLGKPFRRLGTERAAPDGSTGLGLTIVAAIARAHGGAMQLEAREAGGLRVIVELPSKSVAA